MKRHNEAYDSDSIKGLFKACPERPEGLSKENVVKKIKGTEQKSSRIISLKKIAAVAAAVFLFIFCGFAVSKGPEIISPKEPEQTTQQSTDRQTGEAQQENIGSLRKAKSREELEDIILKLCSEEIYFSEKYAGQIVVQGSYDGIDYATDGSDNLQASDDEATEEAVGETNIQVQGVDEGDIIKNDGKYIYYLGRDRSYNSKLRILDCEGMEIVYDNYVFDDKNEIIDISEIYLNGDILTVLGTYGKNYYGKGDSTVSVVLNISDKAAPEVLSVNCQDGFYQSSRMIGSILYTVSVYYVSGSDEDEVKENSIPRVNGDEISCSCIYVLDEDTARYTCVTAFDTGTSDSEVSSLAVLGSTDTVYCSKNNLYTVGCKYNQSDFEEKDTDRFSVINVFALVGTNIRLKAEGEVKGSVINQYSLDEYNGYLRIATTYSDYDGNDISSLYILNEEMKTVGSIEDIAPDEQIKSTRFMGETAYIVTFKNTDPLFVIDLSTPSRPVIKGELKLPGYSTYLHPIGENLLLGVGYDGDSDDAYTDSVKLSLFDISDIQNPLELDSIVYKDANTAVNYNPKYFIYNSLESYVALPLYTFEYDMGEYKEAYHFKIIDIKASVLEERLDLVCAEDDTNFNQFTGTYIGDSFYAMGENDVVYSFSLHTGEKTGECRVYD